MFFLAKQHIKTKKEANTPLSYC